MKKPAYDPSGKGNCGYYSLAGALGIYHCGAHQTVQNYLIKEIRTCQNYYVKLYQFGGNTSCWIVLVHIQANIKLDLFVSWLQHQCVTAPLREWCDTDMRYFFAQSYG